MKSKVNLRLERDPSKFVNKMIRQANAVQNVKD